MTLGNRIARNRRRLGLTQEALAQKCEVTNQAVSKWESDACCPDISLLPKIADIFGITIDELFGREAPKQPQPDPEPRKERKKPLFVNLFGMTPENVDAEAAEQKKSRQSVVELPEDVTLNWEDDGTLRVALFVGKKLIAGHPARERIEFCYEGPALNIHSECGVTCDEVRGNVWAGGDVSCDSVGGEIRACGDVNCDDVNGPVHAGGDVNCDGVADSVTAHGDVNCDGVSGHVQAAGDVTCDAVEGNLKAGGDVSCEEVYGSVSAGGDVTCGQVYGSVNAGGSVEMG